MSNSNPQTEMTRKMEKKQNKTKQNKTKQSKPPNHNSNRFHLQGPRIQKIKKQNRTKTNKNFFIHQNPNTFHASSNTRTGEKTKEIQKEKENKSRPRIQGKESKRENTEGSRKKARKDRRTNEMIEEEKQRKEKD
uniref:Uncharacterized protein n=1 Tax=Cucumis melo TaxID=3656 RepID=A0A9I9CM74_CUCME